MSRLDKHCDECTTIDNACVDCEFYYHLYLPLPSPTIRTINSHICDNHCNHKMNEVTGKNMLVDSCEIVRENICQGKFFVKKTVEQVEPPIIKKSLLKRLLRIK
jgi:hypothetical protein